MSKNKSFVGDIMGKSKVLIFGLCGESVFIRSDHFHQDGETVVIDELYKEPGGKGYNQAVTCKKQDVDTCFVSMVGDDEFGKTSKTYLDKVGVENIFLVNKDERSAFATIHTDKHGNNRVSVYPGASSKLKVDDIIKLEYLFTEHDYLLLTLELSCDVTKKIIDFGVKHKCKIILNPAPFKEFVYDIIDKVWLLIPNYQEANALFHLNGDSYDELGQTIKSSKIKHMVVTLGKDGVLLYENGNYNIIPSVLTDQKKVIDTTGAGDVFCGALVSQIVKGYNLLDSVNYAVKASSFSIQYPYVMPGIPSVCDVIYEPIYQEDIYFPYQEKTNTRNTVRVFAENEEGKIGLLRILGQDDFGDRNHLETPGGGIEKGECKLDAVTREVKEELGYNCKIISKICTIIHEFNLINRITVANYYYVKVDTSTCETNYTESEKKLFKGVEWFSLEELVAELTKPNNNVGKLVHDRELLALNKLVEYFKNKRG